MGGEGAMMAANNSLKNNRSLLAKRKDTKALEGSYANVEIKTFPKASAEQLEAIKAKLQAKNKLNQKRLLVATAILVLVLLGFLWIVL